MNYVKGTNPTDLSYEKFGSWVICQDLMDTPSEGVSESMKGAALRWERGVWVESRMNGEFVVFNYLKRIHCYVEDIIRFRSEAGEQGYFRLGPFYFDQIDLRIASEIESWSSLKPCGNLVPITQEILQECVRDGLAAIEEIDFPDRGNMESSLFIVRHYGEEGLPIWASTHPY